MSEEACCTCAALLSSIPHYDEKTEKPTVYERRLDCCGRAICARCTTDNPRFTTYCPFCQVSVTPSPLPQGLRDPPPYESASSPSSHPQNGSPIREEPPPYVENIQAHAASEKSAESAQDVLHFVDAANDTVQSLSLRYGVPAGALRRTNGLYADHLMAARRTVLIPGEFYKGGVSLNPRPMEGEEEELRKKKIRKWMVACKVAEYDIALLYLKQAEYNLEAAIEAYKEDERWEKEHPFEAAKANSSKTNRPSKRRLGISLGFTSQLT